MKKKKRNRSIFKMVLISFMIGTVFLLYGCGDSGKELMTEDILPAADPLAIDDIDWFVNEAVVDGQNRVVFGYTNNSDYIITDVELEFMQKAGTTPEQLSVFSNYKEDYEKTDEEISEVYILGYNRKFADPDEKVTDSTCVINGTFIPVESMSQYEIMEPDNMVITYIGADNMMHIAYYNFKTQTLDLSNKTEALYEWSDTEFSSILPKPECLVVNLGSDDEESFSFTAYGNNRSQFEAYVELCKEAGFTVDEDTNENSFSAYNSEGTELVIGYVSIEEKFNVNMDAASDEVN